MPCPYGQGPLKIKKARIASVPFLFFTNLIEFRNSATCRKLLEKFHDLPFGPESIIAAITRNKRAVSPALRSNEPNMWILRQCGVRKARKRNKWIILSGHHERGHANFAHDAHRA